MNINDVPPWQITDEALDQIDAHLAVPDPEHGAALLVAAHTRLVVGIIPDPVPGEIAAYWHSEELNENLNKVLVDNPMVRYGGAAHSHPGAMAWPSADDHVAFRSVMTTIPSQREALFPIVVQRTPEQLRMPAETGEDHLVPLPNGTLATYTGHPTDDGMLVTPCRVSVMPLRSSIDDALARFQATLRVRRTVLLGRDLSRMCGDNPVTAGPAQVFAGPGASWLLVPVWFSGDIDDAPEGDMVLVFPQAYPELPPLVRRPGAERFAVPAWDFSLPVGERLHRVLLDGVVL